MESEFTSMDKKGQVVIPKSIRDELGLDPRTKFVVYSMKDTIILKKLSLIQVEKQMKKIFDAIDQKGLPFKEEEIDDEVQAHRKQKRRKERTS